MRRPASPKIVEKSLLFCKMIVLYTWATGLLIGKALSVFHSQFGVLCRAPQATTPRRQKIVQSQKKQQSTHVGCAVPCVRPVASARDVSKYEQRQEKIKK